MEVKDLNFFVFILTVVIIVIYYYLLLHNNRSEFGLGVLGSSLSFGKRGMGGPSRRCFFIIIIIIINYFIYLG
jgi:cell shape-determining protein MreC